MQAHGDAGLPTLVAVDHRCRIESGDEHVERAIAIEVGKRDSLRDRLISPESPFLAGIGEMDVGRIAQRDAPRVEARNLALLAVPRHRRDRAAEPVYAVRIADVPAMSV